MKASGDGRFGVSVLGQDGGEEVAREGEVEKLHAKIRQLPVERDFFGESLRSMSVDRRRAMIEPGHPPAVFCARCTHAG